MGLRQFTTKQIDIPDIAFGGGLNTTAGALTLENNEASDLQNIDFNRFGSFFKRNGSTVLNSTAISNTPEGDGLHWFEYDNGGTLTRRAVAVADGKLFHMSGVTGTWTDITGGLSITAGSHCDFETFLNDVYITNGTDAPFKWDGVAAAGVTMTVPTGLTSAHFVAKYNNYLFLANCVVSGTTHRTRIYWSNIGDTSTWTSTDFIDVARNDGESITGLRVLADRLVIYKERSIYNLLFTGDADIPFILPGGGKSNSAVGCASGFSIQDARNGHIFLAYDGLYIYDGANSFKLSDRINITIDSFVKTRFSKAVSLNQKTKNKYWISMTSTGSTNDTIITYDYALQAFSLYKGLAAASLATFYVSGIEERPYFSDYNGYTYRADDSSTNNDNPLKVETAVDAFYKTNWRAFGDLVNQKGVPEVVIYYQQSESILTFGYSFDFEEATEYSQTINLTGGGSQWDVMVWDVDAWAGSGGSVIRQDLTGRGRVVRLIFSNAVLDETFRIEGIGTGANLETNV